MNLWKSVIVVTDAVVIVTVMKNVNSNTKTAMNDVRFVKKRMNQKHIHKYIRKDIGRKVVNDKRVPFIVYACNNCTHYLLPEFILGKESLCWNCNNPHRIKTRSGRIKKKNVCDDCFNKKNRSDDEKVESILREIKVI